MGRQPGRKLIVGCRPKASCLAGRLSSNVRPQNPPSSIFPVMTQTQFFEWLGSPLHNVRWSWGAVRNDGVVFLRIWQDETTRHNGLRYMRVTNHGHFAGNPENLGYRERLEHLKLIGSGAPSYMVMCEADPAKLPEREILDFNEDYVFRGGSLVTIAGDSWLELGQRIAARTVRLPPQA